MITDVYIWLTSVSVIIIYLERKRIEKVYKKKIVIKKELLNINLVSMVNSIAQILQKTWTWRKSELI